MFPLDIAHVMTMIHAVDIILINREKDLGPNFVIRNTRY